jgi:hypothetical protein
MRVRIESKAKNLPAAIDAAWEQEHPTCPECDGTLLSEDGTICWGCSASDYLQEARLRPGVSTDETYA